MELITNDITMTSKDLAEITGKEHKNILADIRKEMEELGEEAELIFKLGKYKDLNNQSRPMYIFGKDGAMQMAMKYSAEIRRKVILKLEELENKTKHKLPNNYIEALKQLVVSEEARVEAENKNAILMHVNKTYTMTEIAKEINLKSATQLNKILKDKKIQYKTNGTWVMYSKYSELGYENIKQEVMDNGRVIYHRKITQLGRDFILSLFE